MIYLENCSLISCFFILQHCQGSLSGRTSRATHWYYIFFCQKSVLILYHISLLYSFSFLHAGKENISSRNQCYYKVFQSVASKLLIICSFIQPVGFKTILILFWILYICVKFLFAVLQCSAFIYMCLSLEETPHQRNWSHLPALHDEIVKGYVSL
jgi:hypothetical protein